jgi:putative DNA primase/helicase
MSADRAAEVADLAVARSAKRREEAVAADASHHDLAVAWRTLRTLEGHAPVYTRGAFYVPSVDGLWVKRSAQQVEVEVAATFNGRKLCRKRSDFTSITAHIAAVCEDENFFDGLEPGVVTPLGFHRLNTVGQVESWPLKLEHRQTFRLQWMPEADAECPLLDGVLRDAFDGDDADAQVTLWWEAVGASLFGLMAAQQIVMLLLGRERSGKSVLQRLLEGVYPAGTVGAVSPASWGHEYHVAALAGAAINIVGELSDDAPIPAAAFKNVTGQNLVAGRHPTHRPFSFRCTAAHWFASNVLPPTTDRSEAFYRRWRVLLFRNTVPADKVDPELFEKIMASEMPAVLFEAFKGAERVARAGRLSATRPHEETLARWRMAANPLQQFLLDPEWVELDPAAKGHSTTEVYQTYRRWAALAGFRNPFGRNHFIELLDSTGATRGVTVARSAVAGLRLVSRDLGDGR